jgi:hypothetical protein
VLFPWERNVKRVASATYLYNTEDFSSST